MYGLRYSNKIDDLSKRDFAALCVALLKLEVSSGVMQVSTQGNDGLRDAWFEGTNLRNSIGGKWIFQFKQYTSELGKARQSALKDFESEMSKAFDRYTDVANYIFLTNVPHSGTATTGTFDKVQSMIFRCAQKQKHVEFWDGQELCNLIDIHYAKVMHLIGFQDTGLQRVYVPNFQYEFSVSDPLTYMEIGNRLLSSLGETLLSPQNGSLFSSLYFQGDYENIVKIGNQFLKGMPLLKNLPQELNVMLNEILIYLALAWLKMGQISEAKKYLNRFSLYLPEDNIYVGHLYNVMALIAEKNDDYSALPILTKKALDIYERTGASFCATDIKLRQLHKVDWKKCENENTAVNHQEFLASMQKCYEDLHYSETEKRYLQAMKSVYIALHCTWNNSLTENSEKEIVFASDYFKTINNISELARLLSERGRIRTNNYNDSDGGIKFLRQGLDFRMRSREMNRVRYDLIWLSQAYETNGNILYANLAALLSKYIHYSVLGLSASIDKGLLRKIDNVIMKSDINELIKVFYDNESGFYNTLMSITDLDFFYLATLFNYEKFRLFLRSLWRTSPC